MKAKSSTAAVERTPAMATDVSPIAEIGLQPGDVILTALAGPLSTFIQKMAGVPVSHAGIMITPDVALEARADDLDMSETTGQAFWATLDELVNHDRIDHVVVRRPPPGSVDVARLKAWAVGAGRGEVPFASAGLTMMAALKLWSAAEARVLGERLHSQRLGRVGGWIRRERRELAEAIADGPTRLICAELAYRGLHAAGVRLDLDGAEFATALADLPDVERLDLDGDGDADGEIAALVEARVITPGPITSAPERRPRLRRAAGNLKRRWADRHTEVHVGDRADLITPRDLLVLDPLETVASFERRNNSWHRIGDRP